MCKQKKLCRLVELVGYSKQEIIFRVIATQTIFKKFALINAVQNP